MTAEFSLGEGHTAYTVPAKTIIVHYVKDPSSGIFRYYDLSQGARRSISTTGGRGTDGTAPP